LIVSTDAIIVPQSVPVAECGQVSIPETIL